MDKSLFKVSPKSDEMVPIHPRFFSAFNPPPHYIEENTGGSITNPDQGLTIQEMIEKYVHGDQIKGHDVYFDDNEDNVVSIKEFDLSDLTSAQDVINAQSIQITKDTSAISNEDGDGGTDPQADEGQQSKADKGKRSGTTKAKTVRESANPPASDSDLKT